MQHRAFFKNSSIPVEVVFECHGGGKAKLADILAANQVFVLFIGFRVCSVRSARNSHFTVFFFQKVKLRVVKHNVKAKPGVDRFRESSFTS